MSFSAAGWSLVLESREDAAALPGAEATLSLQADLLSLSCGAGA